VGVHIRIAPTFVGARRFAADDRRGYSGREASRPDPSADQVERPSRVARLGSGDLGTDADVLERFELSLEHSRRRRAVGRAGTGRRRFLTFLRAARIDRGRFFSVFPGAAAGHRHFLAVFPGVWRGRNGFLTLLAAALTLVAVVGGGVLMEPASQGADPLSASAHAAPSAYTTNPGATGGDPRLPTGKALAAAMRYAAGREGLVSFAVVDADGRLLGQAEDRRFVSASAVKALLLAAELRRLDGAGLEVDATTRDLLARMITWSDNAAADAIYARVGDSGLTEVATHAGMERFSVLGHWTAAQITAADMAIFFSRLDRVLPASSDGFGKELLASIVPEQSWGIPTAAGNGWRVRFKGGWRSSDLGQLVHQAAELRRGGERIGLAVLTDAQPSQPYGIETVQGITERLLERARR
jgi:hypothetical protein